MDLNNFGKANAIQGISIQKKTASENRFNQITLFKYRMNHFGFGIKVYTYWSTPGPASVLDGDYQDHHENASVLQEPFPVYRSCSYWNLKVVNELLPCKTRISDYTSSSYHRTKTNINKGQFVSYNL